MLADAVPLERLRRALVIKLRHHGDVLLASPVFTVLKNRVPEMEIDALVYADTAPMLELHPAISQVHRVDRNWKSQGPMAQLRAEYRLLAALRARRYDLVIHLTGHPRGAWLARATGARYSVAPKLAGKPKWWRKSFTHLYGQPANTRRHTVECNLDALRRIGIQPGEDERRLVLVAGEAAEEKVTALLGEHGLGVKSFIHFHPASRWLFKCWPVDQNAELLARLYGAGQRVVLTAAPDPREQAMIEAIVAAAGVPAVNLAGRLSLKELAALAGQAKLFIGVDSAPMHIAAAMGTPCVALFGPSGELEWHPWGVPHRIVASRAHPCRPCGIDGCGGGKISECLTTLPLAQVLEAVEAVAGVR